MPESERYKLLQVAFAVCKLECVDNFDSGSNNDVAQILALHPGLDVSSMDVDKIVVKNQLVDVPAEEGEGVQEKEPSFAEDITFGVVTGPLESLV